MRQHRDEVLLPLVSQLSHCNQLVRASRLPARKMRSSLLAHHLRSTFTFTPQGRQVPVCSPKRTPWRKRESDDTLELAMQAAAEAVATVPRPPRAPCAHTSACHAARAVPANKNQAGYLRQVSARICNSRRIVRNLFSARKRAPTPFQNHLVVWHAARARWKARSTVAPQDLGLRAHPDP